MCVCVCVFALYIFLDLYEYSTFGKLSVVCINILIRIRKKYAIFCKLIMLWKYILVDLRYSCHVLQSNSFYKFAQVSCLLYILKSWIIGGQAGALWVPHPLHVIEYDYKRPSFVQIYISQR